MLYAHHMFSRILFPKLWIYQFCDLILKQMKRIKIEQNVEITVYISSEEQFFSRIKSLLIWQFRIRRFKIRGNMWWSCYLPWKKSDELTVIFCYFLTELHLLHSNWRNSKKLFQELIILMFSQGKNSKQTKNKQTNNKKTNKTNKTAILLKV